VTRISIPALRDQAAKGGTYIAADGFTSVVLPRWEDVAALVEAVEAAQIYYDGDGTPGTYTRHKVRQRLADALARFDFGENK
jgi:hypothetical protein